MKIFAFALLALTSSSVMAAFPHDWEDLPPMGFVVPDMGTSQKVDFFTQCFLWLPAGGTCMGFSRIVTPTGLDPQCPDMEKHVMSLNNINLHFDYKQSAYGSLKNPWVPFAYFGGNINLSVNGDFVNLPDIMSADGKALGGCVMSLEKVIIAAGHQCGYLAFDRCEVDRLMIGGQELWIDGAIIN